MVIEVPNGKTYGSSTFVRGAQVVVQMSFNGFWGRPGYVHTFDLSQRGRNSLPLLDGADGIRRRVLFADGVNPGFKMDDNIDPLDLQLLSDGRLIHLVSHLIPSGVEL